MYSQSHVSLLRWRIILTVISTFVNQRKILFRMLAQGVDQDTIGKAIINHTFKQMFDFEVGLIS